MTKTMTIEEARSIISAHNTVAREERRQAVANEVLATEANDDYNYTLEENQAIVAEQSDISIAENANAVRARKEALVAKVYETVAESKRIFAGLEALALETITTDVVLDRFRGRISRLRQYGERVESLVQTGDYKPYAEVVTPLKDSINTLRVWAKDPANAAALELMGKANFNAVLKSATAQKRAEERKAKKASE